MWEHWSSSTVYETDQDQPASCHNTAMSLVTLSNGITSTCAGKSKQKPTSHAIVSLLEVVIYERQQLKGVARVLIKQRLQMLGNSSRVQDRRV